LNLGEWFFKIENLSDLFLAAFGVCFIITAISWISFSRLTMARIERRLRAEGKPRLCSWDGVGARALWYAWAIALPIGIANPENDPLIDVLTVRRMATRADWWRAVAFMTSSNFFLFVTLVSWAFD